MPAEQTAPGAGSDYDAGMSGMDAGMGSPTSSTEGVGTGQPSLAMQGNAPGAANERTRESESAGRAAEGTRRAGENTARGTDSTGKAAQSPKSGESAKKADNTGVNQRDRQATLTPTDQGNSTSETKITAAIRKGIMGDKNLSFAAKNVKVITTGSRVTLRGPVKSSEERATIEALARQTAGVTDVDNQLEVKQ